MSETKPQSEMKTRPLGEQPSENLAVIHAIAHLKWEREWYEAFEVRRAQLLDTLSSLHQQMSTSTETGEPVIKFFLLAGETVILEDIAAIRPDLVAMLVIFNAGGRLGLGPWYVTVNESLVSGEALVRNLMAARADAAKHGLNLMPVAYIPDLISHVAQLPQILNEFGIDAAFMRHGAPVVHIPFRWEAPNGSSLLVIDHELPGVWPPQVKGAFGVAENIQAQRAVRPHGPFLWLFDTGSAARRLQDYMPKVQQQTGLSIMQSDLARYVRALRSELPDGIRPSLSGELRLQAMRKGVYLHPGTLTARINLKQANAHLQTFMTRCVEPWLTVALTHGQLAHHENLHALLDYGWRLLLKTQARNTLGGTSSDVVHDHSLVMMRQVQDVGRQIIRKALAALPGTLHEAGVFPNKANTANTDRADRTYIMVWNALNWPVQQMVEITPDLPPGKYPARLRRPDGEACLFSWQPDTATLAFIAQTPGIGYAAYTVELGDQPPDASHHVRVTAGVAIRRPGSTGDETGNAKEDETITVEDGVVVWRCGDHTVTDLLRFFDGGDAGDTYNYSPPEPDAIVQAELIQDVKVESSLLYERLMIRHRMRIAPELKPDRSRGRGVKLLELITEITLYEQMPGVYIRTTFENTAKDHRLRAHIRSGINNTQVLTDSMFALVDRPVHEEGPRFPDENQMDGIVNTQPVQSVIGVGDDRRRLAIAVKGLHEYEAIPEDGQITIALTLLRAVGWLSRDDLRTRSALLAPQIETPGAQCQHSLTAEYMLLLTKPDDPAALLRAGEAFNMPVQAYQYDTIPERATRSFLSVVSNMAMGASSDGNGAIITAMKPPEKGGGWVIRLYNPHAHPVEVWLTPFKHPEHAQLLALTEQSRAFLRLDANGRVSLHINPHQIVTIRFFFSENS